MSERFGFSISIPRSINLDDESTISIENQLLERVPSYSLCIGCGGCTATCSAGQFTPFNIRRTHTSFRRGQFKEVAKSLNSCMLCGKCTLICPKGVNLRSLIINMKKMTEK